MNDVRQSATNDRVLVHRLLVARARSVLGLCDVLSHLCLSDAETKWLEYARVDARSLLDTLKLVCVDRVPATDGQRELF